jgi:O-acetyl-ADP-ribose deacetylase (regulator of RNase III)
MFEAKTEALINTVNCVGVMGKGVALEFKRRWPQNYKEYKKLCDAKSLRPGQMFIFDDADILENRKPQYLINFPTKDHWRSKSKIEYISDGLDDLIEHLKRLDIKSVALPPLGCGNGGLDWAVVKPLIEEKLSSVENIQFHVYEPEDYHPAPEHAQEFLAMNPQRAMLIKTLGDCEKYFDGYFTKITAQKITYFLQILGVNLGLKFAKNHHGPYSETLSRAFKEMEKMGYIAGYSKRDPEIRVTYGAYAAADDFLQHNKDIKAEETINRLSLLISGFESPYGMELLASVHFVSNKEKKYDLPEVIKAVHEWNDNKRETFLPEAIESAFIRLKEDKLIAVAG